MTCAEPSFTLADLLYPVDVETFLRDGWGRQPSRFGGGLRNTAQQILTLAELERVIATLHRPQDGWLHLGDGVRRPLPSEMLDADGMVDLGRLRIAFQEGMTIYLTKAHRLFMPLKKICHHLERELHAYGIGQREAVSAHLFLTPPGAQGFVLHRDEHASFVLQIEGSKDWDVYQPSGISGPRRPGAVDRQRTAARNPDSFHLQAGDVLYIPEWWPHEAKTGTTHSLHVTLRVFPLRWLDFLLSTASYDPGLSRALPRYGIARGDQLASGLGALLDSSALRGSLEQYAGLFAENHRAPAADEGSQFHRMIDTVRIRPDSWLIRNTANACHLFREGGVVGLRFAGGVMRAPVAFEVVLECIARSSQLRVTDLPDTDRTYNKVHIARQIVECGLYRCDDTVTDHGAQASPVLPEPTPI